MLVNLALIHYNTSAASTRATTTDSRPMKKRTTVGSARPDAVTKHLWQRSKDTVRVCLIVQTLRCLQPLASLRRQYIHFRSCRKPANISVGLSIDPTILDLNKELFGQLLHPAKCNDLDFLPKSVFPVINVIKYVLKLLF